MTKTTKNTPKTPIFYRNIVASLSKIKPPKKPQNPNKINQPAPTPQAVLIPINQFRILINPVGYLNSKLFRGRGIDIQLALSDVCHWKFFGCYWFG